MCAQCPLIVFIIISSGVQLLYSEAEVKKESMLGHTLAVLYPLPYLVLLPLSPFQIMKRD